MNKVFTPLIALIESVLPENELLLITKFLNFTANIRIFVWNEKQMVVLQKKEIASRWGVAIIILNENKI